MIKKDHELLAEQLLRREENTFLSGHRGLFMFGCVEPDLNLFTYLRGSLHKKVLRGHNAENVQAHIRACIARLQRSDRQSAYWYFSLGTLMHYIADSFTYPHNRAFSGSFLKHRAYESALHEVFERNLFSREQDGLHICRSSAWSIFALRHRQYEQSLGDMDTDCYFIIRTCQDILASLLDSPLSCAAG